jgi:mannose/cellobiose epimerase-like protein (N-acyl-D-glucosamine 2-epimerase family)
MADDIRLSWRQQVALAALTKFASPAGGGQLAAEMTRRGRDTTAASAHQAGHGLWMRGLAAKSRDGDDHVSYQISAAGRDWLARHPEATS